MSVNTITYTDKQQLNANASIPAINKCQAADMNEIKSVVNSNANLVGDLTELSTTDKTSIVNAINEVKDESIIAEIIESTVSVAANSVTQITVNTGKDGYTTLGIVSVATGDQAIGVTSYRAFSGSSILVFRNFSSSAKNNIAIVLKMLYKKN